MYSCTRCQTIYHVYFCTDRLECQVQAYPEPVMSWHINGIEIKASPKYTICMEHNKSVLLINNVEVADSGVYTCRAVSEVGEAISSTTLYVTGEWPRRLYSLWTGTMLCFFCYFHSYCH